MALKLSSVSSCFIVGYFKYEIMCNITLSRVVPALQELQLSGLSDATLSDTSEQMSDPARGSGSENASTLSLR